MKSSRKGAKAQRKLQNRIFAKGKLLGSLAFVVCVFGQGIQPSWAEGSKELVANGGYRPYLEWSTLTTAGITRQTTLKVYVQAGEIVNLGSSVHTSANANGTKDIVYRSPFNGQNGSCDVLATGFGFIDTVDKESAGPLPNAGGYTPCSFTATETGIYEVEFRAPSTGDSNPPPRTTSEQFPTGNTQGMGVAAWDITVRDSSGNTKKGRVFTNYVAMNMGGNAGKDGAPSNLQLNSKLYIQTKDGYRYETDMNGVDPYGFIFFANSRGYIDKTNNTTLYRSARATNNDLIFTGNVQVQNPSVADTATDITHLVFFNQPDTVTLLGANIPISPIIPAEPTNFKFTGGTGGSGNQTYVGVGGYFSFDSNSSGSYQIIIDTNNDGIYDPSSDRVIQNVLSSGSNVVLWDGKNASGVNLQPLANNAPYKAQITTRAGEYHFPMLDAENNPLGFKIKMENPPAAFPNLQDQNGQQIGTTTIYYNDNNYTTANGTAVNLNGTGATNPRNASKGVNSGSGTGEHEYSNNYGDFKGIDTWTYFPSQAVITPLVITTNKQANVKGTKSVRFLTDSDSNATVTVGDQVEYTITYSNLSPGNSDAINFVIKDDLPSQLTYVSGTITSATTGNNITFNSAYNGAGAVTNSGTLRVGDSITIKIIATIKDANGGNAISNQASATFNTPDNASATVGTVLTDADSANATPNPPTLGDSFLQTADDNTNSGNDPSKSGDDDPTLFTVTVTYQVSSLAGKVIINEVLYNETGTTIAADTNDEFIELYNASSSAVDLSGVKLTDGNLIAGSTDGAGGFSYIFPNGTTLQPGQYAVIWIGNNQPNQQATGAAFQTWLGQTPKLNNSGDDIWLYDNQNKIIDYVAYGTGNGVNTPPPSSLNLWDATYQSSLAGSANGQSISLTPNGKDTNTSACWEATTSKNASTHCSNYLPTRDTDNVGSRITSVGEYNNGTNAKLLLIKRITRINNQDLTEVVDGSSNVSSNATNYVPEPYATEDNDDKWSTNYLRGAINAGNVKPGDEIEYTIYFLSKGPSDATNVKFCDLVPANTTFIATAFNGLTPNDGGSAGADQGIALAVGSNTPTVYLTNIGDASDRGRFYPANDSTTPASCGVNTNGAVVVDVTKLPAATGTGTPDNSYGFIRFRAKVK